MNLKSKSSDVDPAATVPPLVAPAALEGGPRRDRLERLRYVWTHPAHLVCFGALLMIGVFAGSPWMLIPILALEAICMGALPRLAWVKRRADRRRRERRRLAAARTRASLVAYMEPYHGRELTELERRAAHARAHAASVGDSMEALLDDWYGLDRLLGTYVRLSMAHRTARESAQHTDRDQLCHDIRDLEAQREKVTSRRMRRLIDRELSILRSRAACLERNEEEREALARELSSIATLCRLIHERAFSLVGTADLRQDVERAIEGAHLHDQALAELSVASDIDDNAEEEEESGPVLVRVPLDGAEDEEELEREALRKSAA
jgi:hypothetical protein